MYKLQFIMVRVRYLSGRVVFLSKCNSIKNSQNESIVYEMMFDTLRKTFDLSEIFSVSLSFKFIMYKRTFAGLGWKTNKHS